MSAEFLKKITNLPPQYQAMVPELDEELITYLCDHTESFHSVYTSTTEYLSSLGLEKEDMDGLIKDALLQHYRTIILY